MTITPSRVPGNLATMLRTGNLPSGDVGGGEGVVLDLIVFEVGQDIAFQLLVIGAADGTRTCSTTSRVYCRARAALKAGAGEAVD